MSVGLQDLGKFATTRCKAVCSVLNDADADEFYSVI